jgi:sugar transferase (PEP-CTERM/EpsH1 system associated)
MNILFVAPRLPYPDNTGARIRMLNILKQIARNNSITFLSFCFENDGVAIKKLEQLGIQVHVVTAQEKIKPIFLLSKKPVSIEKYFSLAMAIKLKEILGKNRFDLVHFDHLHIGQYRRYIERLPCILDEHNVETLILKRCAKVESNILKKIFFLSQANKMLNFEADLVKQFTRCLVVSEEDKYNLIELSKGGASVEVIPNGVDLKYFYLQDNLRTPEEENSIVFTGSMDWLPNIDAVRYFCKEILPFVWQKQSNVKFYAVGKNAPLSLKNLSKKEKRIIVAGEVKDVRPYIANSKVFIVPIRIGGGTRLKILEAMAMGKPVVSTSVGAEGIAYTDGKNICIKDTAREFASAIVDMLLNENKRIEFGRSGRELVLAGYDWQCIGEKLDVIYRSVLIESKN